MLGEALDRILADDRLLREALRDATTGLPTRALLQDRMDEALARSARDETAAVVIDIDRFQAIGESLGHEAGDEVLSTIASRLRAAMRPADTLARVAEDELAVLCEDLGDPDEAISVAMRLVESIAPPIVVDDQEIFLTASAGIA